ncbi:hypothetical protein X750_18520 [Mesorhizobium sp. LNJC394B00]|nr:hypothetical protein X750_18520 [Mesorhizobium sp. LNJC394B00]
MPNQQINWIEFDRSLVFPRYGYYACNRLEQKLEASSASTTLPIVNKSKFSKLTIPLPPLDEQRRIAAIMDKADALRRNRKRAIELLESLTQSIFLEMFGNANWPTTALGDLCKLVRGSSPRPQGDPRYFGGDVPRLMIGDITRDGKSVTPAIDSLTQEGAAKSRPMPKGSVVMAVSGAVGLPAILATDACIHDGFVGFRDLSPKVLPDFLYEFLVLERDKNRALGTGAIWINLTTDQVRRLSVPIPPGNRQRAFVNKVEAINAPMLAARQAFHSAEALFYSFQHRAFSGQL